ncbi:MAG: DUF892 family protein [Candidatus Omnitrophica bacterium]|nr:DUF892 family protein [Candidatus Omnitrophota bacterium]MDE2009229.1 DUF892 family protein [Candidatus Omnitrophota bacterium]MDE2213749.1 DUF892 family protein [Candidatus Omnitrophota bacterium]MDE2230675.1 DUF892 family protein [Candidatus Omnitrophota bacterium]
MKEASSLSDLLMEELADLLDAEHQLMQALPEMAQTSQWSTLKSLLEDHGQVTKEQAGQLQDVFSFTCQKPRAVQCKTVKGLITESRRTIHKTQNAEYRDQAIINMAQRIEHYEITGYSIARGHADDLGHTRIVELLDKILDEERSMHLHLSELAQGLINLQAIDPQGRSNSGDSRRRAES